MCLSSLSQVVTSDEAICSRKQKKQKISSAYPEIHLNVLRYFHVKVSN
jgi:hypothetical protein